MLYLSAIGKKLDESLIAGTLDTITSQLQALLRDEFLDTTLRLIFGQLSETELEATKTFLRDLANGEHPVQVEVVPAMTLHGAWGAFSAANRMIYISESLLDVTLWRQVLLEELGHYIDAQIHETDAPGDEGALFAAIVQGQTLTGAQVVSLQAEQDTGAIVVNGQSVNVEFAAEYGSVTLNGDLSDWTATDRLVSQSGYEIYGKYTGNAYVFAVKSDTNAISTGTTFFLNTDQNLATGQSYGADYFVNVFTDQQPYLYTGDGTYLKLIDHAYSTDRLTVEFAIPTTDLGSPTAINFLGDINDLVYFPADYSSGFQYTLSSVAAPPPQTVFGTITLDGNLNDWSTSDRLDYLPGTSQPGYESYGKYTGDAFVFAIKAPTGTTIGQNTTIWIDSDRNSSTGYQIFQPSGAFGGFGGAEFQINIDPDGKAYLYQATGTNSLQRVNTPLSVAFDSAQQIWEVAVPTTLLGSTPAAMNLYADMNNTAFLPGDYTLNHYTVFANKVLPTRTDISKKIGIIYSETSANQYFSKTAYSQLLMSVQDEAMMAGIPFDLLTEADLTDLSKLVNYDALVFPSFQNVSRANLQTIQDNLTDAVYQYGISLIAAGNFMTNDETGAALPDAYSRMRTLLNLQPTAFGTSNVSLKTSDVSNPVLQGYATSETIRDYINVGWNAYTSVDATRPVTTLVNQTVNSGTYNAVVTTQTGGKNVHFATEGYLGDTNLLWQALQWTTYGNQPSVKLSLTRQNSLFLSRNDMDTSQEASEVRGIYDRMLPILDQWKSAYNFVGSYYINIGNNPAGGEYTDWSVSKPYYDRILTAGNEIGTHSYTHFYEYQGYTPPENTNVATDAQLEFEFNQSQQVIEQQLGISVTGAALPGAPETLETALKIIQYFDYISGGYSGVGAGYPNAFGYLAPGQSAVYLAPNLYFDFTLIEFGIPVYDAATGTYVPQKLTADQAKTEWIRQWNEVTAHAHKPIAMMPWHDYGPTNWANVGYTTEMFTGLIEAAYNSGAEFTTLQDASQRIKTFEQSRLVVDSTNNTVTATVTPAAGTSLGQFGLDLGTGFTIKSVNNWYAYDNDTVFLPANGGTFTINLGNTPDDVTRITTLPMRAELLSLNGNGEDLQFSFIGDGQVILDLKNPTGMQLTVQGADSYSLVGEILTLNFNPLNYLNPLVPRTVNVDLSPAYNTILGTTGNDRLTATANPDRILANAGNDTVTSTIANAQQKDFFDGSTGTDTLVLAEGTADTALTLTVETATNQLSGIPDLTVQNFEIFNFSGFLGRLTATGGSGNDSITAGAGNDVLNGGDGNDTLNGGAGNDTLDGGAGTNVLAGGTGDDTYIVSIATNTITEASGAGIDTVLASVSYTLVNNIENLTLTGTDAINGTGNGLNNVLTGNSADNLLNGGGGIDTLIGGAGNDTYVVNSTTEVIIELENGGIDTVTASVAYSLSAHVENLTLSGTNNVSGTGNDLNNVMLGNSGNNTLNGNAGNDTLIGGAGNDTYVVDSLGDRITELAGQGTDTVQSSITWTLDDNLENLTLTGSDAIDGTGNSLNNTITGNSGDNLLTGGGGNDRLVGGLGNDTYRVDAGDTTVEQVNAGIDLVLASVTWTLSANLENLVLTGTTAINGSGNGLNNIITGNDANNALTGNGGNDSLDGGNGNDSLSGGAESDTLNGGTGNDSLTGNGGADVLVGGVGDDTLSLGSSDSAVDTVIYNAGDGSDTVTQFVRTGTSVDLLQFNEISAIDVVASGNSTVFRLGDGVAGNAGFGSGAVLVTLNGVTGFTAANISSNISQGTVPTTFNFS